MINSVRNTVLAILNKNNYGYISPSDFNLYAKQAQLDVFEDYIYNFNHQVNKENSRLSGTGYADIKKLLGETIDSFSVISTLTYTGGNDYVMPSDYYLLNKVIVYTSTLFTGANDNVVANKLEDSTADFSTVKVGDVVINTTTSVTAEVYAVDSATVLSLSADIFTATPENYTIYDGQLGVNEAEKVSNSKITMLNSSLLTVPTTMFPAYTHNNTVVRLFPNSIIGYGAVRSQYIRYPLDPKWTYTTLTGGEPVFNQSQNDYQDFELPLEDEPVLIRKILQYAGMSIREIAAVQFGQAEDQEDMMEKK